MRVRHGTHNDGLRYIARDKGRGCEHAVWLDGRVVWRPHKEGGEMHPFTGPDDVYDQLIRDGLHLWR